MAILYNVVLRDSPVDGTSRYYAQRVSSGLCTLETIAQEISEYAGQSEGTVYGILVDLNKEMITQMLQSYGISMGNIGKMKLKFIKPVKCDSEDAVTADTVTQCGIIYTPSSTLKAKLDVDNTDVSFTYYPKNS